MPKALTIELDDDRLAQVDHLAAKLRMAPEEVVSLALNLVIGEWKEQWPELEAFEPPGGSAEATAARH
ncbi:hypothetical protein [Phenylobacterium sp.]|uniref:hypothetical protein n=1 Tax=Phenylobacterium sp. TaxID=1871053 RepID=UPI0008AF3DAC|nr:MAG: hypothetical protein A2882_09775 [Phenylobacterium sp. RIFCSPHIGHO2_01_FULL_70_10]